MGISLSFDKVALVSGVVGFINRTLWAQSNDVDRCSHVYFLFKNYPDSIKKSEIDDWITLQEKMLNPFSSGSNYSFKSKTGVHIWFSRTDLDGIPETAMQLPLTSGKHVVKSSRFFYEQSWTNGVMTDCISSPVAARTKEELDAAEQIDLSVNSAWATSNKLDEEIRSPHFWLFILLVLFLFVSVWFGSGLITTISQLNAIETKNEQLSEVMSDRLVQEANIKELSNTITTIYNWQSEDGYLPHTFTNIASQISQFGDWTPNVIKWQSKMLEIEFESDSIDLAALITQLEKQPKVSAVNIRPHIGENTWLLEVQVL